jgi:hypothetical protein
VNKDMIVILMQRAAGAGQLLFVRAVIGIACIGRFHGGRSAVRRLS